MSVYQPCDIRGLVTELSPDLYRAWGRVLGGQLQPGQSVVVGGDVRTTTPTYLQALCEGFATADARVLNLGIMPTPMIYFAKRHGHHRACAVVTASHNPPKFNGLKWMIGDVPPSEEDVLEVHRRTESLPSSAPSAPSATSDTDASTADVQSAYVSWLHDHFSLNQKSKIKNQKSHPLRLILDPGNGCWSGHAAGFLRQLLANVNVTTIHDTPDGTFPSRDPDCAKPQHLTALASAVRNASADMGIAFDGDGDRVAFVDDQGIALTAEQATWVFLQSMPVELASQPFVYDLKFSDLIPVTAKLLGAQPVAERSGHAFIRTTMIRRNAVFGAEISGHYFYRDLAFGDDGFYSALRLITWLAAQDRPLSSWRAACPPIFMTPDFRVGVPVADRLALITRARDAFADLPQTHLDGTRIDFAEGWALVRASVTEPSLTFRFEGRDAAALDRVVAGFCQRMGTIGEQVRALHERRRASV